MKENILIFFKEKNLLTKLAYNDNQKIENNL
jgi:hypothetical protein